MSDFLNIGYVSAASKPRVVIVTSASVASAPARAALSPRRGSQSYFWSREWQQSERLVDYDYLIGGDHVYKPADVDDLIDWLDADGD